MLAAACATTDIHADNEVSMKSPPSFPAKLQTQRTTADNSGVDNRVSSLRRRQSSDGRRAATVAAPGGGGTPRMRRYFVACSVFGLFRVAPLQLVADVEPTSHVGECAPEPRRAQTPGARLYLQLACVKRYQK